MHSSMHASCLDMHTNTVFKFICFYPFFITKSNYWCHVCYLFMQGQMWRVSTILLCNNVKGRKMNGLIFSWKKNPCNEYREVLFTKRNLLKILFSKQKWRVLNADLFLDTPSLLNLVYKFQLSVYIKFYW